MFNNVLLGSVYFDSYGKSTAGAISLLAKYDCLKAT